MDRMPPQDQKAEKALLGALLRSNHCIADMASVVRVNDFHAARHQVIFEAIVRLWDDGKPADLVTVADALKGRKEIGHDITDKVTYEELSDLWDAAPTPQGAAQYAEIVKERSLERSLLSAANDILREVGTASAAEVLENAEKRILGIADLGADGQAVHIRTALSEVADAIDRRSNGEVEPGVPVDWLDLAELIGDFRGGEMCVIAARISVGKTSLGIDIARRAAKDGTPVLIVSLEQSKQEIAERLLSATTGIGCQRIRSGDLAPADIEELTRAMAIVGEPPVFIDDKCNQSMLRIAANARRIKHKHGLGLMVIDYIQLIEPENRKDSREQQVAGIARRIKWLARELDVPIIALAQLNRSSEQENRRPRLSDLRESDGVGQDADKVLLLWRPNEPEKQEKPAVGRPEVACPEVEVIVAKNRNGRTGLCALAFRKECMRFEAIAHDPPQFAAERGANG